MIFLLDTSEDLDVCQRECGVPVGQLITPLTRFKNRGVTFAIDNGAFAGFDRKGFLSLLEREKPNRERCLFVACPDIVGSARRTLEVWDLWREHLFGWPRALVLQDGIEDLTIPWDYLDAVFIGGTDSFKNSEAALHCARAARTLGKWVHVGRVNSGLRYERWEGEADSADGSGVSRFTARRKALLESRPLLGEAS